MNWSCRGRKCSCPNVWYYSGMCLETLKKMMKHLSQDLNSETSKDEAVDLPIEIQDCELNSSLCFPFANNS
jgi:hypothetical protein